MRRFACILALLVAASTLETVRPSGTVRCGSPNDTPGSGVPGSAFERSRHFRNELR